MGSNRTKIVVATLGFLGILVAAIWGRTTFSNSGSDCSVAGNNNVVSCDRVPPPSVVVVPGPEDHSWALKLRNWEPNTTVRLRVLDPNGIQQDLGEFAERIVGADGTADTQDGFYFWEFSPGEPTGKYQLEVTGTDLAGRDKIRPATFVVP